MKLFNWKHGGEKLKRRVIGTSLALCVVNLQGCTANNSLLYSTELSVDRTVLTSVEFRKTPPFYVFSLICAKSILFCGFNWN